MVEASTHGAVGIANDNSQSGFEKKRRRPGLIIGIVAGCVLVLLGIAVAIWYIVGVQAHAPDKTVEAYLSALIDGDTKTALHLSNTATTASDVLLTDEAYHAATNHITDFTIESTASEGGGAAVTARLTQGTVRYSYTFTLVKTGADQIFFDRWKMRPFSLGEATVSISAPANEKVSVAGILVVSESRGVSLRALPGTYPVAFDGDAKWYAVKATDATVIGFNESGTRAGSLDVTLNSSGKKAAVSAVNAYIKGCAASTKFAPPGCPFAVAGENPDFIYTDQVWTVESRPKVKIGSWRGSGWAVTTTKAGSIRFDTQFTDGNGGAGSGTAGPLAFRVSGWITHVDGSGAAFRPRATGVST